MLVTTYSLRIAEMNQLVAHSEEDETLSLPEYIAILRRRKWPLLITSTLVALFAFMVAFLWPAFYQSQATILIEEQEVPREFVTSTITSYAAQQIQVISQRVLTVDSIAGISDKYGLFVDPATKRRPPATEIALEFRDLMSLELVSADVIDPRSGRPQEATIAFTLAFEDRSARVAQQVTNELVTLFLDENLRNRIERVENTEEFLAAQAANLNSELISLERAIADFKAQNGDALPELYQYNLSTLERRTAEVSDIDRRIRELSRRRTELGSELEMLSPRAASVTSNGQARLGTREQLRALNEEYQQKLTVYQDRHPDIVSLKRRIEELRTALEQGADQVDRAASDNPAFIIVRTQLTSVDGELVALAEKREELARQIQGYQNLLSRSPVVERDYNSLQRDYSSVQARYQDVKSQQRSAELAESMESERKGERFVLVEPPSLAFEPSSPNRPALVLVGVVLALVAGVGVVLLLEAMDGGIYTDKALTKLVGVPPFAVVGYIETREEKDRRSTLRKRFVAALILVILALTVLFHIFIKPIDVAFFTVLNALGV